MTDTVAKVEEITIRRQTVCERIELGSTCPEIEELRFNYGRFLNQIFGRPLMDQSPEVAKMLLQQYRPKADMVR